MRSRDRFSSLFWMALGAGICYGGVELELGTLHDPGSGFLFFWLGVIMIGLSAIVFVQGGGKAAAVGIRDAFAGVKWLKILLVLIALSLYGYLFETLGFIPATTLLLVFLFKAVEPQRWWVAVLGAVASSVAAYVLFQVWLGCQLPKGLLDLW
jgi:putative tricarboxylic transport membrane protein